MKYKCLNAKCEKTFLYPAKRIVEGAPVQYPLQNEATNASGFMPQIGIKEITETKICPFCGEKEFEEQREPQPEIVSVKSVDLADVDAWLEQGYVVESLYAKTATLVKREVS